MIKKFLYFFIVNYLIPFALQAQNIPPVCGGNNTLIALIDRPSVAYSPCTVPAKMMLIESGYTQQKFISRGRGFYLPETELRLGLRNNTEIDLFPPSYNKQNHPLQSGFGSISIGLKHALFFDTRQLLSLQGYITPPTGNQYFGTLNTSFLINAIYNYNFNSGVGISTSFGFAANSSPASAPNKTYYTFNPILLIGWSLKHNLDAYIEFYGQSKTAVNQGLGVSVDGGLILLVAKNITLDIVFGQRIFGYLNNVEHYLGTGFVLAFG